jgi:fructose-specific phosphotransferase system IIC component
MKTLLRQLKLELANARDATLLLAIIAGFFAGTITQLLKAIFSSG